MSRLQLRIERKVYPSGTEVLRGLDLEAAPGEFVALVGPSGCGKSTLLNIVGGLDRAMEGGVEMGGQALHGDHATTARIGYLFQEPRLMPWLSAEENVALVLGDTEAEHEAARRLLGEVGLAGFESAFPGQLSGGMQRRVALCRAFAVNPELLLMDEPFQSLDAPTAAQLRAQLLALWREARPTVLFVTHDLREALSLADRVVFLSPRPARVVLELDVELPRPREIDGPAVTRLYTDLMRQHPQLLHGAVEVADTDDNVVSFRVPEKGSVNSSPLGEG